MGFSFLAVTVCHLYIIMFHFVHTDAPRLFMLITRVIIAFLCLIVSSWFLAYTFHVPKYLFRTYCWGITGGFLLTNLILSVVVGCTVNFLTCLCLSFLVNHCHLFSYNYRGYSNRSTLLSFRAWVRHVIWYADSIFLAFCLQVPMIFHCLLNSSVSVFCCVPPYMYCVISFNNVCP